jgi:hypothetical protein
MTIGDAIREQLSTHSRLRPIFGMEVDRPITEQDPKKADEKEDFVKFMTDFSNIEAKS